MTRSASRRCNLILAAAGAAVLAFAVQGAAAQTPSAGSNAKNPASRFDGTWNKATPGLRYASNPPYRPESKARFESLKPQDDPRNPKSLTSTEAPAAYNTTGPEGRRN